MRLHINIILLIGFWLFASCHRPSVPQNAKAIDVLPTIYPDFTEVTIPSNLCPINFMVREPGEEMAVRVSASGFSFVYGSGKQVVFDEEEWKQLRNAAKGGSLLVEVFMKENGQWLAYRPFKVYVATEEIDAYLSYRLIPPSYVGYEELIIEQRNLTSFETQEIYNNKMMMQDEKGHCINCHSYKNYRTDNMLFHVRKDWGGTVIVRDGQPSKVNLKTPATLSAGVYPAWHPTEQLIAFSTNLTAQMFLIRDTAKVEVFDGASDLILYDAEANKVTNISNLEDEMECFPTWSPDGRWLYFTSAKTPFDPAAEDVKNEAQYHYDQIHYDLCRKSFDPATRSFGPTEMVYEASADTMSVSLPRVSPDGRWLAFARAPYGCFHVWHPTADICLIDLASDSTVVTPASGINSNYSESYPTFSSNGRWLMAASRRDDGSYTRPYISYFDENGHCHKPFEVPQESPTFYTLSFKSFNRPEFMIEPVQVSAKEFEKVIAHDAIQAE